MQIQTNGDDVDITLLSTFTLFITWNFQTVYHTPIYGVKIFGNFWEWDGSRGLYTVKGAKTVMVFSILGNTGISLMQDISRNKNLWFVLEGTRLFTPVSEIGINFYAMCANGGPEPGSKLHR